MRSLAVALCLVVSACQVEVSYEGTRFRCAGDPPVCPPGFECISQSCVPPLGANQLVHWSFDDISGDVARDESGNGRDGVITGATGDTGRFGNAIRFDGLGGSASDANAADYLNGQNAVTVAVWVRSDLVDADFGVITGRFPSEGDTGDGVGISIRYDALGDSGGGANGLKVGVSNTSNEQQLETPTNTQTTDWQHLAFTWDSGADIVVFLDGEPVVPMDLEPAIDGPIAGLTALVVGKGAKDIDTSWSGLIDELRIYDGVLTVGEIRAVAGL